ncbi:Non-classical export protein [Fulvia fulva]|uniref:Non-classical export protein n=1 Tax=Passalora fulva TaxID=5499 RepID=A0A9Q8LES2_PASFU|nr:Non-classical export protein [Fulvia fulva]KAK4626157.1 Non-classical export protein [Fulvia fulva]KAK4627588.1 Non-classical export protein [Fulvia fulva]UJO15894.1 Non-classical export protein [Fulvia fulva]WPV14047.1 Non-classical export protein [Fulvia fulva]WPV28253.1 Non-classical export protein [Fulvia fulva]
MKIVNLALRALQFFMALLIMAIIGNAIAMGADSPVNNYTMFCAAFAMLCLFFLLPATFKEEWSVMPFLPFVLDLLLVLFWFCGAVALAAELGVHSCNNDDYVSSNRVIRGARNQHSACREAQASCAFLWFGWACFVGSAAITGMAMRGGGAPRGGIRRGGPVMSQV